MISRREFLKSAGALTATAASSTLSLSAAAELKPAAARKLPRWRGFNLTEKCVKRRNGNNPPFREDDYAMLADWGFDFTRLPLSYLCWTEPDETYIRVVKRLVEAIRAEDPQRLIIADGIRWGRDPVFGLVELGIAQSTRGYDPMQVSHYKANWVQGAENYPEPTWPLDRKEKGIVDKEFLRKDRIEPWKKLEQEGVGIHVGEWGSFNRTPHKVALAWMRDQLDLWKEAGWGWSLW